MAYIRSEPLDPVIGERIREFATRVYGSLNAFAQATGIHPVQISKYVQNQSRPGFEALQRFHAIGMSIDWLLTGRGQWLRERLTGMNPENTIPALMTFLRSAIQELEEYQKKQPQLPPSKPREFQ